MGSLWIAGSPGPIDVNASDWLCTIELSEDLVRTPELRLGLRYLRGMRRVAGEAIVCERDANSFYRSVEELRRRVPELRGEELTTLAEVGALNSTYGPNQNAHRRTALWDVARAIQTPGSLFSNLPASQSDAPLERMTNEERLLADYQGTGDDNRASSPVL